MRNKTPAQRSLSLDEYMAFEHASPLKYEFVYGRVYEMSGVTFRYSGITGNIFFRLRAAERGGPCRAHMSDMKVKVDRDVIYYPDLVVECVARYGDDLVLDQPCFIAEVTSRSTRRVDRGEKLANYQRIPSLRTYLIVEQARKCVTHYWRAPDGTWDSEELTNEGTITVSCPKMVLTLDEIYESIDMPPLGVAEPEWDEDAGEDEIED